MENGISHELHEEFAERMRSENEAIRQEIRNVYKELDRRLEATEVSVDAIHDMSRNVASLAESMVSVKNMVHDQYTDIREMREKLDKVNTEHIMHRLDQHETEVADHEQRMRVLEEHKACVASHPEKLEEYEQRIGELEKSAGRTALKWLGIAGTVILTALLTWGLALGGIAA